MVRTPNLGYIISMAVLVTLQGPNAGQQFPIQRPVNVLGRQGDSTVCLLAKAVSRQHAQIVCEDGKYSIEDLDSSNGTYLNGKRVNPRIRVPLTDRDKVQIGPYVFALRQEPTITPTESQLVIREQVSAVGLNETVYAQAAGQKLQCVLEISQLLARTLEVEPLLTKLMDQILLLFTHADRCMVLLLDEDDHLVVRGQKNRYADEDDSHPYSRTVVKKALEEGVGILSEDVMSDPRWDASATLTSLNLRSLLCVPLICQDERRLGIIQVDRFHHGKPFQTDDLHLLTTICHQVSVALDNAALHAELLQKERLKQELALAREIQQGFMPSDFDEFTSDGYELFAHVDPAREVSGDLYDFNRLSDGRLAIFVGDVSGKGMPAALFMVAVRTLGRHLAAEGNSPARTLTKLNTALGQDNPSGMFVTLAHGIYDPQEGELVLASGGHHWPLLRRADGRVEAIEQRPGRMLGYPDLDLNLTELRFSLNPSDTLVFYTDGYTEAKSGPKKEMFGLDRLKKVIQQFDQQLSLPRCAETAKTAVHEFTGVKELYDDLTLFLLRRTTK
ncbi:MAG: SpoIIE family protein phosphatase [Gemmataceae bacterium]